MKELYGLKDKNGRAYKIFVSDTERLGLFGRESQITFTRPDPDYVEWLENKVTELLTNKN
jgi:hypothetical protein